MEIVLSVFFFWLGAVFASFAGATAWRMHTGRDFVKERSVCEHCKHQLSAFDLVPIFSWLFLQGKCRYCKKSIGNLSIATEVLFGLLFLVSYLFWPFGFTDVLSLVLFALWCLALVLMAILFVYDARWGLLPDKVMFPLIALSVIFFVLRMFVLDVPSAEWVLEAVYSLAPVAGVYGLLHVVSKGAWIGLGDVKLGVAIGLFVGWQGALVALVLANLLGFLYVLPMLVRRDAKKDTKVPFGPFLIVATVLSLLWSAQIIEWYMKLAYI